MRRALFIVALLLATIAALDAQFTRRSINRPGMSTAPSDGGGGGGTAGGSTIFLDDFNGGVSDIDITARTPITGGAYTEWIDTSGTNSIIVAYESGTLKPNSSQNDQRIAARLTPSPALVGTSYTYSALVHSLTEGSNFATHPMWLVFGGVDTQNLCAIVIYNGSAATDLYASKRVKDSPSDIASLSNANFVSGDLLTITAVGPAFTVARNGSTILEFTDSDCDNGSIFSPGFGNIRLSTDDVRHTNRWDNITIIQTGAPVTTCPPTISLTNPPASPHVTSLASVVLSGQASGCSEALASVTLTCTGANAITAQAATISGTAWSYTYSIPNSGPSSCRATATDKSSPTPLTSVTGEQVIDRTAVMDTERPVIQSWTFPSTSPYAAAFGENPMEIQLVASDNVAVVAASWTVDLTSGKGTCTVNPPVAGSSSILCSGVVLQSGGATNTFTITVTDAAGNQANVNITRQITHIADLVITTSTLPGATQNQLYSATLSCGGGVAPCTWLNHATGTASLAGNEAACTGLSVPSTGTGSWGTPTTLGDGVCNFTVRATDSQAMPDTATRALSIAVSALGVEGPHDYFSHHVRVARGPCTSSFVGTDCVIRLQGLRNNTWCDLTDPLDNGACSMRRDAQVANVSDSATRTPTTAFFYCFDGSACADTYTAPQDGAKATFAAGDTGPGNGVGFRWGSSGSGISDGTLTWIFEEWWAPEWRHNDCGGSIGSMNAIKSWKFVRGATTYILPKHFMEAQKVVWGTDPVAETSCFNVIGSFSTGASASGFVPPAAYVDPQMFGVSGTLDSGWSVAPGNGTFWGLNASKSHPIYSSRGTRHVLHIEFDVPGNSSVFSPWRSDCDPSGTNTLGTGLKVASDQACASMLSQLAEQDPDCGVVDQAGCDITYTAYSLWTMDTQRGARRIVYRAPWRSFDDITALRGLFEGGPGASCAGCGERVMYLRNVQLIRNIDPADIDDTGCPSACLGDSGAVNDNVHRKVVW